MPRPWRLPPGRPKRITRLRIRKMARRRFHPIKKFTPRNRSSRSIIRRRTGRFHHNRIRFNNRRHRINGCRPSLPTRRSIARWECRRSSNSNNNVKHSLRSRDENISTPPRTRWKRSVWNNMPPSTPRRPARRRPRPHGPCRITTRPAIPASASDTSVGCEASRVITAEWTGSRKERSCIPGRIWCSWGDTCTSTRTFMGV
mmetsp:Transcript_26903/g.64566  ORF Transcript_26903/g.64566 Transcript_26903/m.64566 type:complete len:201 (+) Transcript_26903:210-812(+)